MVLGKHKMGIEICVCFLNILHFNCMKQIPVIRAFGILKRAAAEVNVENGLDITKSKAIVDAATEVHELVRLVCCLIGCSY